MTVGNIAALLQNGFGSSKSRYQSKSKIVESISVPNSALEIEIRERPGTDKTWRNFRVLGKTESGKVFREFGHDQTVEVAIAAYLAAQYFANNPQGLSDEDRSEAVRQAQILDLLFNGEATSSVPTNGELHPQNGMNENRAVLNSTRLAA